MQIGFLNLQYNNGPTTQFRGSIFKLCFFFQELYSWDRGNQLTYPVRYNELPGP